MNIVVFASRSSTSYALINRLGRRFPIAAVVFERKNFRLILRHRWRKLGLTKLLSQLLFVAYDRFVVRRQSRARISALLENVDVRPPEGRVLRVIDVESINDSVTREVLCELKPAVVVVSGTRIISRSVLALAPTFINLHAGITPRYRGAHGAFWAIYEGRPELAGTTVHLIDAGVDTGPIIEQVRIKFDPRQDTFRTLPVLQYLAAFDAMDAAVAAGLKNEIKSRTRADLESAQWYSPTLPEYFGFIREMKKLSSGPQARYQ